MVAECHRDSLIHMTIFVESVEKDFDGKVVLAGVDASFSDNEISVLLGASGCGKTTTLRCIAGLEKPAAGRIRLADRIVYQGTPPIWVPPERRHVSMVFQSYAIWPHMSVFENVSLPLRAARVSKAQISKDVATTLRTVGLDQLVDRSATQLSGGQQQRVALARAIVSQAPVILMDEPLSNLDAKLRVSMRSEIRDLQRSLGRTILFVTHDQEEAMSIADTIFLFHEGRILQRGAPRVVYDGPETRYAAEFLGKTNILRHYRFEHDADGRLQIVLPGNCRIGPLPAEFPANRSPAVVSIRPEAWRLRPGQADGGLAGSIADVTFLGDRIEYRVTTDAGPIIAVEMSTAERKPGDLINLTVDGSAVKLVWDK